MNKLVQRNRLNEVEHELKPFVGRIVVQPNTIYCSNRSENSIKFNMKLKITGNKTMRIYSSLREICCSATASTLLEASSLYK